MNMEQALVVLETKNTILEKRVENLEKETKENFSKLEEKLDEKLDDIAEKLEVISKKTTFSEGFIKAVFIFGGVAGFIITVAIKFIK